MASASRPGMGPTAVAHPSGLWTTSRPISDTGVDTALLVCALFLQRFSLSFGSTFLSLDIVPAVFIFVHQFVSGRLVIRYDRLLWFIAVGLAVTCSLLLNFKSTMLPSYCLFMAMYFLFTLSKPSSTDRYRNTLQAFQFLAALISLLAVAQFVAQFVLDGRELVRFYGIFPEFLFASFDTNRVNTIIPITQGSSLIKSNGIFLVEPSTLSQIAALAILIEVLEFRRPRYLLLLALGFLLSYSGTGLMLILAFLPLAAFGDRRAGLSVLLVSLFSLGLLATGIIDLSAFSSRLGEFGETEASAFQRFIIPFWMAAEHIDTASIQTLLLGSGPGTLKDFAGRLWYGADFGTWNKLFYEYGLIGSFIFLCFLAFCLKGSRCPGLVRAAIAFLYIFLGGYVLSTPVLIIAIVLCTLSGPEPRRGRIDNPDQYRPLVVAGS